MLPLFFLRGMSLSNDTSEEGMRREMDEFKSETRTALRELRDNDIAFSVRLEETNNRIKDVTSQMQRGNEAIMQSLKSLKDDSEGLKRDFEKSKSIWIYFLNGLAGGTGVGFGVYQCITHIFGH